MRKHRAPTFGSTRLLPKSAISAVTTNATTTSTDTVDACAVFESGCTDAQTAPGKNDVIASWVGYGVGAAAIGGAILWTVLANSGGGGSASARPIFDVRPVAGGAVAGFTASY